MATYCPINEAYDNINSGEIESIQTNEIEQHKNIEDPHFFQELPFISANGSLINNGSLSNNTKKFEKKVINIEPFQTTHCTHLMSCPYCRKFLYKYKTSYRTILKIILICVIILLLFDLMN